MSMFGLTRDFLNCNVHVKVYIISQWELKQDIQRFKLNHPKDFGINRDMVNTRTGNWAPRTADAAPDLDVHWKLPSCASIHNKSNMINIWTRKCVLNTAAAPDQVIQAHNGGKK